MDFPHIRFVADVWREIVTAGSERFPSAQGLMGVLDLLLIKMLHNDISRM